MNSLVISLNPLILQAISTEKQNSKSSSSNDLILILDHLQTIFSEAIQATFPNIDVPAVITIITNPKFGDYQFNSAMKITQILKAQGTNLPPFEIANKIHVNVKSSPIIAKMDVARAGFINIFLEK